MVERGLCRPPGKQNNRRMVIELRSRGARAVILPEYGGRLHELFLKRGEAEEPILWGPEDVVEYAERPTRGGCFPMAPWPNRIRGSRFAWGGREWEVPSDGKPNAIHGRVLDHVWEVHSFTSEVVELSCTFDEGWPWAGSAWQRFELGETWLTMRLEVRSASERFPAGCGWHPWFRRDAFGAEHVRLTMDAGERYELDAQLPTGTVGRPVGDHDLSGGPEIGSRRLDDCYRGIRRPIEIDWGVAAIRMVTSCQEPHVQVFTPEYALCVEPQTCAPDAFNLAARGVNDVGFAVAEPGAPVSIESRWEWEAG